MPLSGSDSTYPPVQISGATSVFSKGQCWDDSSFIPFSISVRLLRRIANGRDNRSPRTYKHYRCESAGACVQMPRESVPELSPDNGAAAMATGPCPR